LLLTGDHKMPALARTHLALLIHRTAQHALTRPLRHQLKLPTSPLRAPGARQNKGTHDPDMNELSRDELIPAPGLQGDDDLELSCDEMS
jgi:hypothetical protein